MVNKVRIVTGFRIVAGLHWTLLLLLLSQFLCCYPVHCLPPNLWLDSQQQLTKQQTPSNDTQLIRSKRFFRDGPLIDRSQLPMLYIGEVTLESFPECEVWIDPHRLRCQRRYETILHNEVTHRNNKRRLQLQQQSSTAKSAPSSIHYDRNSEDIKRVSCCGMWHARICVIEAITRNLLELNRTKICPDNLIDLYLQLPNDQATKADVMDYCSEYGDGTLICALSAATSSTTSSLKVFVFVLSTILVSSLYTRTLNLS